MAKLPLAKEMKEIGERQPVFVETARGRLFGVVHVPQCRPRELGVIFLSSGLQNRAGPHRIYLRTARRLSELGFVCFRVDLPGVGDSQGEIPEANFDCHDAASVHDVLEFLVQNFSVEKVALLGLCSGARVAVRAAVHENRVTSVIAWGLPIVSGPVDMPVSKGGGAFMGPKGAKRLFRYWAPKAINPASWHAYFKSGKTIGEAWNMVRRALSGLLPQRLRPRSPSQQNFLTSMESYINSQRRALFVYAEADRLPREEFVERYQEIAEGKSATCELYVVSDSDHTFSPADAQTRVIERTVEWVNQQI